MLNVLITIDLEAHPIHKDWKSDNLRRDISRDIEGRVGGREVGLDYQLDVFARHGLRAVFMVETLFSAVPEVGTAPLEGVIARIQRHGHEIQLHAHCEWIEYCPGIGIPFRGPLQRFYNQEEQTRLIRFASEKLQEAGAPAPIAFRAGGYAADEHTILALKQNGFQFDTSYNVDYPQKCRLPAPPSFGSLHKIHGIHEASVAAFQDYPGHWRPAQICACSYSEMVHALEQAEKHGWTHFVIVSHSFEMLSGRWQGKPRIREEVVARFEGLCKYLSDNRHKYSTVGFENLAGLGNSGELPVGIRGNPVNTAGRLFEQALNRLRG